RVAATDGRFACQVHDPIYATKIQGASAIPRDDLNLRLSEGPSGALERTTGYDKFFPSISERADERFPYEPGATSDQRLHDFLSSSGCDLLASAERLADCPDWASQRRLGGLGADRMFRGRLCTAGGYVPPEVMYRGRLFPREVCRQCAKHHRTQRISKWHLLCVLSSHENDRSGCILSCGYHRRAGQAALERARGKALHG